MNTLTITHSIAHAAGTDAANRSMKKGGRKAWSRKDYNEAVKTMDRLMKASEAVKK